MEVGQLYQFALVIVLVAMIVGLGVLVLDKLSAATGVTADAQTAINAGRDALGEIATSWLSLIVLIGAISVVLVLVIRSFASGGFSR
jgi:hypothetical protein